MQTGLTIIWIVFFLLFLKLALWHRHQTKRSMPHIQVKTRPMKRRDSPVQVQIEFAGNDLDQPLEDFAAEFNQYVDRQNSSSHNVHRLTAFGYSLAALTSLISAAMQVWG